MISIRPFDRRAVLSSFASLAATALLAAPASAHIDEHFPIGGKSLKIGSSPDPEAVDAHLELAYIYARRGEIFKAKCLLQNSNVASKPDAAKLSAAIAKFDTTSVPSYCQH